MGRLRSIGAVAATVGSLIVCAASGSAQSFPDSAARPAAAEPHGLAAKPPPGSGGQRFAPAYVLTGVELRSGPGARYDLVQVIPEGNTVGVARCAGAWCEVVWRDRRGFAAASALSVGEPGPAAASALPGYGGADPADYGGGPHVFLGFDVGFGYGPHSRWHRRW